MTLLRKVFVNVLSVQETQNGQSVILKRKTEAVIPHFYSVVMVFAL